MFATTNVNMKRPIFYARSVDPNDVIDGPSLCHRQSQLLAHAPIYISTQSQANIRIFAALDEAQRRAIVLAVASLTRIQTRLGRRNQS